MEHAMTLESDTARKSVGGDAGKRNAMSRFRAALNAFDLPIQKPKTMMWGGGGRDLDYYHCPSGLGRDWSCRVLSTKPS